jgi:hypothetical protein
VRGNAHDPGFAVFLQPSIGGEDLLVFQAFGLIDRVDEGDIQVIGLEPLQAGFDAAMRASLLRSSGVRRRCFVVMMILSLSLLRPGPRTKYRP